MQVTVFDGNMTLKVRDPHMLENGRRGVQVPWLLSWPHAHACTPSSRHRDEQPVLCGVWFVATAV